MRSIRMFCIIQELALDPARFEQLTTSVQALYSQYFGPRFRVIPCWVLVPAGQSYVARRPAHGSWVQLSIPSGTPLARRHAFMHELKDVWLRIMVASVDELVLNVPDFVLQRDMVKSLLSRWGLLQRIPSLLRVVLRFERARRVLGHRVVNVNATS